MRYRLRTPVSYYALGLVLIAVGAFAVYASQRSHNRNLELAAFAIAIGTPLIAFFASAPYRAWPGGHVTLAPDAIVVRRGLRPRRFERELISIMLQQVKLEVTMALVTVGTVDRGQIVTVARGSDAVRFSTTLVAADARAALVSDLERFLRGEPLTGPAA